ncbi:ribbon-helix-helix protein, CopG family [Kingella negevensis]|uniref:Uncharacterized protein n=1 Tax=Kingella negevensis TaxID=1522312 RepID=A0A238TBG5_9NEIS|nr:ribbon-helix-helix protein, CopG family [Kingella negevensis]MDK4680315.1 hypothetical protein [Kingella negevensis]MDK4681964.1 hypothetical protein [Kingella negevensis]MDK4688672.1 hypothetical protein [Kingella negevensis]MDK4690160.1 hypothetical protein [Kingella negevensis]MDK4692494.1 hypothetical protein [Kingella negevensis]
MQTLTLTITDSLARKLAELVATTGATKEQIITEALEKNLNTLRPIPELSPEDLAMMEEIEETTNYTPKEFYSRWGIEA